MELPYHNKRQDSNGQVANHVASSVKDVRGYAVDAVPWRLRLPLLLNRVASQELSNHITEQVAHTENEETVGGPSEASAHAE